MNPTFHKTGVNKKFVALKKNESHALHKGDAISLLPDDICFTVILEECASDSDMTKKTSNAENKLGNNFPSSVVNVVENCFENLSKTKKQLSDKVNTSRMILPNLCMDEIKACLFTFKICDKLCATYNISCRNFFALVSF